MKKTFTFIGECIQLSEHNKRTIINILKLGKFYDPRYDWFEITQKMFDSFIRNFSENILGYEPPLDIGHMGDRGPGAAALYKRVFQEGEKLFAEVEWFKLGIEAVNDRGLKYISSEFIENFQHNESGTNMGATLLGGGLTMRPVIRGLDPVALSQAFGADENRRILLSENLINELKEERGMNKDKYLKRLKEALAGVKNLSEELLTQLCEGATFFITGEEVEADITGIISTQVKLAQAMAAQKAPIKVISEPIAALDPAKALSVDDVAKLVQKGIVAAKDLEAAQVLKLSEKKTANMTLLSEAIKAAAGIGDEEKKTLSEGLIGTITGEESEAHVRGMVATQVKLAETAIAKAKLTQMGFNGNVRVVEPEGERNAKQMSEHLDRIMDYDKMPAFKRFSNTGCLRDTNKLVAEKLLAQFDRIYGYQLAIEGKAGHKMLANGEVGVADTALPYTVMRTVFREAIYNLIAANIIAIETETGDGTAATVFIPFVKRQEGNPSIENLTTFEGKPINYAGLIQDKELAFVNPRKLAIKFSDEVAFFTAASSINYEAVRDNMALVTRMMQEGLEFLLLTEMVMAADEFSVVAVSGENLDAQTDAAKTIFQLAQWPLVRPRNVFDLKGDQIGSTVNPLTVTFKSVAIPEYDGSNTQTAGDYYKITNYSLGQFRIVTELGAVQTPAAVDLLAVSYTYTTNIVKWDKNFASGTFSEHLDNLLNEFGRRKAMLFQDRFSIPNFAYMSAVMNNMVTEAKKFESAKQVEGNALTNDGNLAMVKGIPTFGSNVPLAQIGDLRLIIGERFTSMQKVVRPWSMDPNLTNVVDATGKFTGEKQTYGQQYDAIHTPLLNKGKYTEIMAYDSTADIGPF